MKPCRCGRGDIRASLSRIARRGFIIGVNNIKHPEIRKVHSGASVPGFEFKPAEGGSLTMSYQSLHCLYALVEGFIEDAVIYFHDAAQANHPRCRPHGKPRCEMRIAFSQAV